jgi:tRNA pseudouridine55 synthase
MTRDAGACKASASGVGQNFFDLFSGEKVLVRGGTSDAQNTASSRIHVTDTSSLGLPEAKIRIACSKGTYIRAFARDLGEAVGSGAHLSSLVRTKTGAFRLEDALSLDEALALLAAD